MKSAPTVFSTRYAITNFIIHPIADDKLRPPPVYKFNEKRKAKNTTTYNTNLSLILRSVNKYHATKTARKPKTRYLLPASCSRQDPLRKTSK